jgi:hypothetical protein
LLRNAWWVTQKSLTHIWSPPVLQDSVCALTGTGLLPYIRPVDEERTPLASMRSARIVLITLPALNSLRIRQVFNTPVLPVVSSCSHCLRNRRQDYLFKQFYDNALDLGRAIHRLIAQQGPTHARQFVSQRHGGFVGAAPLTDAIDPAAQGIFLVLGMQHDAACAVDQ